MNPSDWIYHLSLRTTLNRNDFLEPRRPARPGREHALAPRAWRLAAAGAALLAPTLLVVAALLGG